MYSSSKESNPTPPPLKLYIPLSSRIGSVANTKTMSLSGHPDLLIKLAIFKPNCKALMDS
jgi:hypothetical protein